jgi:hypothetical protein
MILIELFAARISNPCGRKLGNQGTGWKPVLHATLIAVLVSTHLFAQTTQPTKPTQPTSLPTPTADFELSEWAIFIAEPLAPRANAVSAIKSTLPSFVSSRRPDAQGDERGDVMPIGVIRILRGKTPSPKFDVLINLKGGEFQGHWPRAENNRTNRLLWSNLIADNAAPMLSQLDEKHWLNRLRDTQSHYLSAEHDTRGERFLLYDAEPAFALPLRIQPGADGGFRVSNAGSDALLDLELYKSKPDGWHKAFTQSLAASRSATKPSSQPADTTPKIKAGDTLTVSLDYSQNIIAERTRTGKVTASGDFNLPLFGNIRVIGKTTDQAEADIKARFGTSGVGLNTVTVTLQPKEDVVAATGPTGPSTQMALSSETFSDPKQLLAGWKDRLLATGIAANDVDLMLDILAKYAIDSGRLTAVYRLDRDRMDELVPEEVVPQPAKVTRVGLVIVRNIDPDINNEIAQLVKQLGDDDWAKREAAQKKLTEFGRAAKSAVEKAARDKDMEVVWRAEAILHAIEPQRFGG